MFCVFAVLFAAKPTDLTRHWSNALSGEILPVVAHNQIHRGGSLAHPSWEVRVTVIPEPRRHPVRDGIFRVTALVRRHINVAVAILAVAGVGGITVVVLEGGGLRRAAGGRAHAIQSSRATEATPGVTGVYRYALGCLGASISGGNATYAASSIPPGSAPGAPSISGGPAANAGGRLDHAGPCWRYGVYVTATLIRVGGIWRLGLEAISPSCPTVSLPASLRAQVAVCRRPAGPEREREREDPRR